MYRIKDLPVVLLLTLTIAVTASVFAIWPVVADAPWEPNIEASVPIAQPAPRVSQCERIAQQLADAGTDVAGFTIRELGVRAGCWR